MCVFNNTSEKVTPSNTILIGGRCKTATGLLHYLGYYNSIGHIKAKTAAPQLSEDELLLETERRFQSGLRWDDLGTDQLLAAPVTKASSAAGFGFHAKKIAVIGNAMLIMVPAVPGSFSGQNLQPLGRGNTVFADYEKAVATKPRLTLSIERSVVSKGAEVVKGFDEGLYDIVIASSASKIPDVLEQVAADKRPVPNLELYAKLDLLYPDWTCLLFCFAANDAERAGGAMITYTSMYPNLIILPGLDGHSGDVDTSDVEVDHTLVLGSDNYSSIEVAQNAWAAKSGFLPRSVIGTKVKGSMPQGDFVFDASEVEAGIFNCLRDLPPGWEKVYGRDSLERTPYLFGDVHGRWAKRVR